MKDQIKSFLNEEQDPKAIEKIAAKLDNLLMRNEEVGYIAVQKKPAITVLPDSIVLTNKRIIICKPKNLGLSMDFIDYNWDDIATTFVKENILGSEFSFITKSDLTISIDYIPKIQARKIATFAKEQLDVLKNGNHNNVILDNSIATEQNLQEIEEIETEEVHGFAEIMPAQSHLVEVTVPEVSELSEKKLNDLSQDELFEKLQNYKRLLDNGLILQAEYDNYKKEILSFM